jgi:hypothetical protein
MEQYIFTLDQQAAVAEYLEYYVEKCQDIMNVILFDPDDANTLEFVEKNLRILQSAMGKSSCMRLVGDKELPELTPNEEDSLVRAVVGLLYQYSKIFGDLPRRVGAPRGDLPHLTTFDELFKYHGYKVSHNHLLQGIRDMIKDINEIGICSNSIFGRDAFHFYLSRLFAYADYLEINIETRTNVLYGIYVGSSSTRPSPQVESSEKLSIDMDETPTKKVQAIVWTGDKLSIHPFITSHSVEYLNQSAIMNKDKIAKLSKILHDNMEEFGDAAGDLWEHYGNLLRAVEADELLLEVAIALRGHENIRFTYR